MFWVGIVVVVRDERAESRNEYWQYPLLWRNDLQVYSVEKLQPENFERESIDVIKASIPETVIRNTTNVPPNGLSSFAGKGCHGESICMRHEIVRVCTIIDRQYMLRFCSFLSTLPWHALIGLNKTVNLCRVLVSFFAFKK